MVKKHVKYVCSTCGNVTARWTGRCSACGEWNTVVEVIESKSGTKTSSTHMAGLNSRPRLLQEIESGAEIRFSSGINELNHVLGGGIVPGSMILIGGDPGIGKSTLLLQMGIEMSCKGLEVLYVTGEESVQQVKMRAERLGASSGKLYLMAETDIDVITATIEKHKPQTMIIDSIQTVVSDTLSSAPGSVSQVRECAARLLRVAKGAGIAAFLVGHVTKEGAIAGPRVLEHMVDCVLYFEGDRHHAYRILRAVKNRFGATNEIGVFSMEIDGLREIKNPSEIMLNQHSEEVQGSVITALMEGTRPMLVEIQSLLSDTLFGTPRCMANGVDYNRVAMLMAVLQKCLGLFLGKMDTYVNVIGGIKIIDPAVDLAVCLAIYSSFRNQMIKQNCVVIGEVGLTGEVRAVTQVSHRVKEAEKLGFQYAIVPFQNAKEVYSNRHIKVFGVKSVQEAIEFAVRG